MKTVFIVLQGVWDPEEEQYCEWAPFKAFSTKTAAYTNAQYWSEEQHVPSIVREIPLDDYTTI